MTQRPRHTLVTSAPVRLFGAITAGILAGLVAWAPLGGSVALLLGVCTVSVLYVVVSTAALWPMDAQRTRQNAGREDFHPALQETAGVCLGVVSLVSVVSVLVRGSDESRTLAAVLGLVGILFTWAVLHLLYGVRYAHEFYREPRGGIDFNGDGPPQYVDFFYFSFNLGMTFQVSDNNVSTTRLRAVILRHCLLSFMFSTVILAATVNLVMGVLPS
ncbi:DUF1345 domain-containing protein [Kocuria sp.]|uniref:DUF1345 domain-containing protein n=1 Tax=Kocuria sp. TaxID=1871328 RepID=UPI0026DD6E4D|nr:DUF1345 domain-containing protein [Kocuria sp.]MDO4918985.1 DUF1345 domain-containing protein [Kocuria sp.]